MSDNQEVQISIPCAPEFVSVARLVVSGVASRMNFSVEDIEDIKIAVSEACTNAVQHAYKDPKKEVINIVCNMNTKTLNINIKDNGCGFDTGILGTKNQKQESEKLGLGLGITFIENLMDNTKITSEVGKGTTVEMEKSVA